LPEGFDDPAKELPFSGVFAVRDGEVILVTDELAGPNGLAFSPDERLLYVSESGHQFDAEPRRYIRRFAVDQDGRLSGGDVFHTVTPGFADGFRVDDRLFVHGVPRGRFSRVRLDPIGATAHHQLDQLDR
jgi:gluconolactonase